MARSTSKVILFSRVTVDRKVHQWPTAIFNKHEEARTFATLLKMAHATGNADLARKMDPKTALDGEGKLVTGLKFSILEVPYSPAVDLGDDDSIDAPETATT